MRDYSTLHLHIYSSFVYKSICLPFSIEVLVFRSLVKQTCRTRTNNICPQLCPKQLSFSELFFRFLVSSDKQICFRSLVPISDKSGLFNTWVYLQNLIMIIKWGYVSLRYLIYLKLSRSGKKARVPLCWPLNQHQNSIFVASYFITIKIIFNSIPHEAMSESY
jgi:hypothetical protein